MDWITDHPIAALTGLLAAVAAVVTWAVIALGGASCPRGQHQVLLYEYPVVDVVNNVPITTMIPVYGCQR